MSMASVASQVFNLDIGAEMFQLKAQLALNNKVTK
jgi:hypothetical protein